MNRRELLTSAGAIGSVAVAGCLGTITGGGSNSNVVLEKPDRRFESSDVAYPAWGQQVPDVTVPAVHDSQQVPLQDVEGPALITFFYSHCKTVCPVLVSTLRYIQVQAQKNGYSDSVSFLPVTFDPARDTAKRLQTYANKRNIPLEDESWQFLRPSSKTNAKTVVSDQFGVHFERTEPENMDMYMFTHTSLTLLVNDGYVERAYNTDTPDKKRILEDLKTVRNA